MRKILFFNCWSIPFQLQQLNNPLRMISQQNITFPMSCFHQNMYTQYIIVNTSFLESLRLKVDQMVSNQESLRAQINDVKSQIQKIKKEKREKPTTQAPQVSTKLLEQKSSQNQKGSSETSYGCRLQGCGKIYGSQTALRAHQRSKHEPLDFDED